MHCSNIYFMLLIMKKAPLPPLLLADARNLWIQAVHWLIVNSLKDPQDTLMAVIMLN